MTRRPKKSEEGSEGLITALQTLLGTSPKAKAFIAIVTIVIGAGGYFFNDRLSAQDARAEVLAQRLTTVESDADALKDDVDDLKDDVAAASESLVELVDGIDRANVLLKDLQSIRKNLIRLLEEAGSEGG